MRKLSLFLLLATAAAPALAQDHDRSGRQRGDHADQSEGRSERANRGQRGNRAQDSDRDRRSDDGERRGGGQRAERGQSDRQGYFENMRERAEQRRAQVQQQQAGNADDRGSSRNWRRGDPSGDGAGSGLRPRERHVRTIPDTRPTVAPQNRDRRGFEGHRRDYRDGRYNRWTRDWYRDNRYDWRRYRDRNRSIFRLGFYYDPFGYNYRRWSIGSLLYPSYYGSRYWLNDPWQYRLPPVYGPYRWVRYWNDALLVNVYTGEVVDVIHSFFW